VRRSVLVSAAAICEREFCMGGCRCELKKMERWWRNRRCCECEQRNWIVEHFLSCSI